MYRLILFTALFVGFIPFNAFAELFRNSYLSFELPPNWQCKSEVTEWVCVSKYSQKAKEAIIILTAKEKGPTDSLEQYMAHLKQKKPLSTKGGKSIMSHVYTVKKVQINGHPWVDGLHISSEAENYYTRYLGTTKGNIAVLVTFSGHRQHYTKYSQDFFKAIQSLRVIPPQMGMANNSRDGAFDPNNKEMHGRAPVNPLVTGLDDLPEEQSESGGLSEKQTQILALALIFGAIGFYLIRKRKKGK